MSDWFPIATCPNDRPVEIAKFPMLVGERKANMMIGNFREFDPTATHWREITQETREALRAASDIFNIVYPPSLDQANA